MSLREEPTCVVKPLSRLFIFVRTFCRNEPFSSEHGSFIAICNRFLMSPQIFFLLLWSANRVVLFLDSDTTVYSTSLRKI